MKSLFFTKGRRDLVAKTLTNIVPIAAGAALAGDLFIKLSNPVKIGAIASLTIVSGIAIFACPKRSDE